MKNSQDVCASTPPAMLLGLLLIGLQACSSSGSDSASGTSFSAPVDALTLRSALITGSFAGDDAEFWECVIDDSSTVLQYRLLTDGTGVETDTSNPTVQSEFTWVATSAASINTSVEATGVQNSLSSIQFSGRNNMRLVANENLMLTCERKLVQAVNPEVSVPSGNDSLSYGGVVYGLTHGFEESYSYRPSQQNDTHSTSDFSVANARFTSTTIDVGFNPPQTIWRPGDGTVWFRARLYSPGGGGIQSATFDYEPDSTDEQGPTVSGRSFFQKAKLGVDIDQNGSIDSDDGEFIDVVSGSISVSRSAGSDNATMSFDVTLANGVALSGSFTGQFVLYEN